MHLPEFILGKSTQQLLPMKDDGREGIGEALSPRTREIQQVRATVAWVGAAFDQLGRAQPINQSYDIPLGDQESTGQFLLGNSLAMPERRQDVELRQRHAVRPDDIGHSPLHAGVDSKERDNYLGAPIGGLLV